MNDTNETIPRRFSTRQLADMVGAEVVGNESLEITGLESLAGAGAGQLTFVASDKAAREWPASGASAVLVSRGLLPEEPDADGRTLLFVADAETAIIDLLEAFAPSAALPAPGVHPDAAVDRTARLDAGVRIAEHVSIGARCSIGANVVVHAGARIADDVVVGAGTVLHANVVVRDRCRIGRNVVVHPNATIGADGFGYRPAFDAAGVPIGLRKVPQIGIVVIEDEVEIGAGTCVDRAKFGQTVVGRGTKIDNLCQIAHNCRIGRCCVIAGATALAGSVVIGDWCQIGGGVCVADHLTVGAGAKVAGMTGVYKDIPAGATFAGVPGEEAATTLRQLAALRRLPEVLKRLGRGSSPGQR
ncbi:MAG: UDP-3-O-(3-hydroxymyristoyl)glucosamine N-acyltransferase [Phycisphaerales bacterium]|nr:UDP-3-O-(3-hydroxymyristoyl)glucosamine N-acyltransferase [Phycisphaerales bacterium]